MRVLLTGGHITPLLAVVEALRKHPDVSIIVVSRQSSFDDEEIESTEMKLLKHRDIPFVLLKTGRLPRDKSLSILTNMLKLPSGFFQAIKIIKEERPTIVVSFGSYLSVPICFAAWLHRIPIITHEQSVKAGLANRINSWFAKKVAISFASSLSFFPKAKTVVTGNPVRHAIFETTARTHDIAAFLYNDLDKPLIYVTGGSQGSHSINECVFQALPELLTKYRIIHQTGDNPMHDLDKAQSEKARLTESLRHRYLPVIFVNEGDIGAVYHNAAAVVGRAGANTVTELAKLNKKALFIPLPFAQQDEQMENAKWFVSQRTGLIVNQNQLSPKTLEESLDQLVRKDAPAIPLDQSDHDAAQSLVSVIYETTL